MKIQHYGIPATETMLCGIIDDDLCLTKVARESSTYIQVQHKTLGQNECEYAKLHLFDFPEDRMSVVVEETTHYDEGWYQPSDRKGSSWYTDTRPNIKNIWCFHGGIIPCVKFPEAPTSANYFNSPNENLKFSIGLEGYPLAKVMRAMAQKSLLGVHAVRCFIPEWQNQMWKKLGGTPSNRIEILQQKEQGKPADNGRERKNAEYEYILQKALNSNDKEFISLLRNIPSTPTWQKDSCQLGKISVTKFMEISHEKYGETDWGSLGKTVAEIAEAFENRLFKRACNSRFVRLSVCPSSGWSRTGYIFSNSWGKNPEMMIVIMGDSE